MVRRLGSLLALVLSVTVLVAVPAAARAEPPSWAERLPDATTQVVRTVSSHEHCRRVWCTVTQAWERDAEGAWTKVRELRSTIGSRGWGKQREGDNRSPVGVYRIKVTFTTGAQNPGEMPWKRRRATSVVSAAAGPSYNTWLEVPGVTSGDRPSMRSGWVVDYNHVRLRAGEGPRPVPGKGKRDLLPHLQARAPVGADGRLHPGRRPASDALAAHLAPTRGRPADRAGALTRPLIVTGWRTTASKK